MLTLFQYKDNAWKVFYNNLSENQKLYIDMCDGYKENLYCLFITYVNLFLNNNFRNVDGERINAAEALHEHMMTQAHFNIKADTIKSTIEYLNNNKNNIKYIKQDGTYDD